MSLSDLPVTLILTLVLVEFFVFSVEGTQCGCPEPEVNTEVQYTELEVGSVAMYTCIEGSVPSDGVVERVCQNDTTWSLDTITCTRGPKAHQRRLKIFPTPDTTLQSVNLKFLSEYSRRRNHINVSMGAFSRKSDLIMHKKVHTGEEPCNCDTCASAFKTNSQLKIHK
ncbi:hypothetical protein ScPMuIL_017332 [Solemya velum]